MKKVLVTVLAGIFIVTMAGCGGPKEEAAPAGPGTEEQAAPAPSQPPAAPPAEEAPAAPAEESAEAAPAAEEGGTGLVGTKWKLDEYVIEFQDDTQVLVKGGQIATLMPDGATGEYKIEDGKFSVSILGMTKSGTWDGDKLVVDGVEAIAQ
jgi:hypothetical protein